MIESVLQFGFSGFVVGCLYAIAAGGLTLTYTTTGVFNFAHGAVGALCAYLYWWITVERGLSPIAGLIIVVVLVAPLLGLLLERLVFRRFRTAPIETTLVVSIALTLIFLGVTNQLFDDSVGRRLPPLIGQESFEVGPLVVKHDQVGFLIIAVAIALGLRFLLFSTRMGTTMRAVVDSPSLAELSGANASAVSRMSWAIGCSLAATSGILIATGRPLNAIVLTFLILNAYAAAVVGRIRSLPLTFAGAIALGMIVDLTNVDGLWGTGDFWNRARLAVPAVFLFAAMLALPVSRLRTARPVITARPQAPSPARALTFASLFVGVLVVSAVVLPGEATTELTRALVIGVVMLSVVLVTGYGGQISLAPYVFMAVGAAVASRFSAGTDPLGLLVAAVVVAPIGALVAIPTLRLQGLYVALSTFAFALAARELIVGDPRVFGSERRTFGRPDFGLFDTADDKIFLIFVGVAFALLSLGLVALRRGRYGRRLAALRDSEAACATLGFDVRRTKLAVFTMSAAIAGFGGALFANFNLVVSDVNFEPINGLVLFLYVVVGGVTSVSGAGVGGALFALLTWAQLQQPTIGGLVFAGIGLAAIGLGANPNGLVGMITDGYRNLRGRLAGAVNTPAVAATEPVA